MPVQRQPAIFLPHGGGPCFFMDWSWGPADTWKATQHFLEGLASTLPETPKVLLVASGHWEEPDLHGQCSAEAGSDFRLFGISGTYLPADLACAGRSGAGGASGFPAWPSWAAGGGDFKPRLRPRSFCSAEGCISRGTDSSGDAFCGRVARSSSASRSRARAGSSAR